MSSGQALHYRSLADVAADMRAGKLTAVEVTRHTLARIEQLEPRLHAFSEVCHATALKDAEEADKRRARGDTLGVLHGVPIAVKDLCAMAGTRTGAGGFFPTGFAANQTATVVQRLQQAGAVIVGKAQLTEGAWGAHHPDIPDPVNPWAAEYWSGASSSGSGVSVAAGLAYGAIGTDTAGSIRFPSSCNHLVGLKPTWGRVSRHGVFPLSDTLDHVGPMTRSVLDAGLMFAAIAGADSHDPTTRLEPVDDYARAAREPNLKGVRIGLDAEYAGVVDPMTGEAFQAAVAALKAEGATIVEVTMPKVEPILERATASALVELAVSHATNYPSHKDSYSAYFRGLIDLGLATPSVDYAAVAIWRREYRGALVRLFQSVDLLVAPAVPAPPLTAVQMKGLEGSALAAAPFMRFTLPFNLAGLPTLTMPLARSSEGVPRGFQLIGPALGEARLLSAGAAYEKRTRFSDEHPSL